ncbi:hypothetical protein C6496_06595 [Candidatus Poribacteria bacterium]|nr:MAG: hypothetical protein C6496_06595 [Candidatus Poribacteria bacterium]
MKVIVDTNVPLVANGKADQASEDCVETCIDELMKITAGNVKLVLDDLRRIIGEYRNKLNPGGFPGVGDAFLKWVEINWANPQQCDLVSITPTDDLEANFQEFPTDPTLAGFDPDDRKFIAVALAHPEKPPILQASDTAWWHYRDALHQNGVTVDFICEDDVR